MIAAARLAFRKFEFCGGEAACAVTVRLSLPSGLSCWSASVTLPSSGARTAHKHNSAARTTAPGLVVL
jgi:hypothetical protein